MANKRGEVDYYSCASTLLSEADDLLSSETLKVLLISTLNRPIYKSHRCQIYPSVCRV